MDTTKYTNRVEGHALVLGGSGGIGSEIVRALVANGARAVTVTYNSNKKAADKLAEELKPMGVKVHAEAINQTDEAAFRQFLERAVQAVGEEITVAVNSIGWSPNTPIEEQTFEEHLKVAEMNHHGPFFSGRAILERMRAKQVKGSMVIITSTNGVNSQSQISAHYDAAKVAVAMHVRNFAEHYARFGIRVNGVAPGWINTPMNDTLPEDERKKETAKIWNGRFAEPSEVASFVAFVAGSGGSYIIGQNLMIDGGYR